MINTKKVNCSALYPYFDSLANDEATLKFKSLSKQEYTLEHTSPVLYVEEKLREIYTLFEGVLELSLVEVKTLYFERKINKFNVVEKADYYVTKKAKELCIGDKIVLSAPIKIVEVIGLKKVIPNHIRFEWEDSYRTYLENILVDVLK